MAVELNNPEKRMLGVMQSNENEDWTVQKLCNLTKFEDQAIIVGAGIGLVEKLGGEILGCAFIINLPDLGGSKKLEKMGISTHFLCEFEGL